MRILYSHRVQSHDGQSVHIEELVAAFRNAGHEVCVVGPKFYENANFGGESHIIATARRICPGLFFELAELIYNVPAFLRLRRAYRDFAPDLIYERYNLYYFGGVLLKMFYRVPFYLEINSPIADERSRFGGLRLRTLARALERIVWKSADRVFVVSAVLGAMVAEAGVMLERITVIPNGVGRDAFSAEPYKAVQRGPTDPVIIGFVGFVREWHGLSAVVDGLASDRDELPVQLVIVGPPSEDLERQAQKFAVANRIRFVGLHQRDAIPNVIRTFDIALQPRAVAYASPLKLFEYMASGRAIAAPDQENIREVLKDGENAVLFDPEAPGALWRAIRQLATDPQLRERLGRAARRTLDECDYTWEGNASKVINAVRSDLACTQTEGPGTAAHSRARSVQGGSQ
jgi:glycosyltransferase involved in cell wall biosynthesis